MEIINWFDALAIAIGLVLIISTFVVVFAELWIWIRKLDEKGGEK